MSRNKIIIGGFKTKIWKVCGNDMLRPVMMGAYIENGFIYATNAFALIKQSLFHIHDLDKEEVENLEGKWFSVSLLKHLEKCEIVKFNKENIECYLNGIKMIINYEVCPGKYPNIEAVLDDKPFEPTEQIGINPNLLKLLYDTMSIGHVDRGVKIQIRTNRHGFIITSMTHDKSEQLGMIMPLMLNND